MDESQITEMVESILARRYGRLMQRFFRGVITVVTGASGNYNVQLRRLNETTGDGNVYQVAPTFPGTPVVGDAVECMWRDQTRAYVLWKAQN